MDVALLIPSWSELKDWRDRTHLYVHQRPQATGAGARVWLCKDRRLVYSYRIDGFLDLREHLPGAEAEEGAGWAIAVSDGKRANRDLGAIPDPDGVAARWMQGFRYMEEGATAFVKAPRARRRPEEEAATGASVVEEPAAVGEPGREKGSWAARAARRLSRPGRPKRS